MLTAIESEHGEHEEGNTEDQPACEGVRILPIDSVRAGAHSNAQDEE
jgi:hypothetical protein